MTLLPSATAAIDAWHDIDRRVTVERTAPAAGGVCTATFDNVETDQQWLIERIAISNTSSNRTLCSVYDAGVSPQNLRDYSKFGNSDIADENSPIVIPSGSQCVVQWSNCNNGDVGTVTIQYRVQKKRLG